MKSLNIALLGFGTVGKGVWDLIKLNPEILDISANSKIKVTKVLVPDLEKDRGKKLPEGVLTTDYDEILKDDQIDVVVEVTGSDDEAYKYMEEALKVGKHVVTANKHVMAHRGDSLYAMAEKNNLIIGIGACVCGAIPVVRNVLEPLSANKFTEILGIMNGTSNFILDKMDKMGLDYSAVLKEAQELGYAEVDPTADVKGLDARNKIAILASLAFNEYYDVESIGVQGIDEVTAEDFKFAKSLNCTIKLIARALMSDSGAYIEVKPMLVHRDHPFYSVTGAGNAVVLKGNCSGDIVLMGQGAGSLPTASAVVGDVIDIALRCEHPSYFIAGRMPKKGKLLKKNPIQGNFYFETASGLSSLVKSEDDIASGVNHFELL